MWSAQFSASKTKLDSAYCSGVCEGRPDMKLRHSSGAEDTWPLSAMLPASDLDKWHIAPITIEQVIPVWSLIYSTKGTVDYRHFWLLAFLPMSPFCVEVIVYYQILFLTSILQQQAEALHASKTFSLGAFNPCKGCLTYSRHEINTQLLER